MEHSFVSNGWEIVDQVWPVEPVANNVWNLLQNQGCFSGNLLVYEEEAGGVEGASGTRSMSRTFEGRSFSIPVVFDEVVVVDEVSEL